MQAVVAFLSGNYTNSQFCQALAADAWKKLCQKATFFAGAADVAIQSHDINCRQIYPNLQNERKNIWILSSKLLSIPRSIIKKKAQPKWMLSMVIRDFYLHRYKIWRPYQVLYSSFYGIVVHIWFRTQWLARSLTAVSSLLRKRRVEENGLSPASLTLRKTLYFTADHRPENIAKHRAWSTLGMA